MKTPLSPDLAGTTGEFPVPTTRGALDRLNVPGPRALLTAILALRAILVGLLLAREFAVGSGPGLLPLITSAVALGASARLIWRLRGTGAVKRLTLNTLLVEAMIDVTLVTSLVATEGNETSQVAAFYLAILTAYALLLSLRRALFLVALVAMSYVGITLLGSPEMPGRDFWSQLGVIGFIGVVIAVLGHRLTTVATEQRALSQALAQVRLEAEEILGTIQSGVITVDADGCLRYLNPRARRILGGGEGVFTLGGPVMETLRARSRELHDAILLGIRDGTRVSRGEASVRREDGTLFPVGLSTTTFLQPGSDRSLVTGIFTDISELKRLQEFRLRAERLEAIAALSASLAHEIRNPLAAIRSAVEQLARAAGADEDEQVLAELVMRESERLNRLLSEFLDFSRVRATEFQRLDLLKLVQVAASTVAEHPAASEVTIDIVGEALEIDVDADLMHRVVSNLLLNAAQAIDGVGTITISVGPAAQGESPRGPLERPVKLMVRDTGPGIPSIVQDRLFEPFATGRPGGTGLGLPIVQRAVAAHRGIILVDTAAGVGTTFTIFLPETWNGEATA